MNITFSVWAIVLFASLLTLAQQAPATGADRSGAPHSEERASASVGQDRATGGAARVVILTDEQTGTIRFIIDGRDVARLDTSGLYVDGAIKSTGSLRTAADRPSPDENEEPGP